MMSRSWVLTIRPDQPSLSTGAAAGPEQRCAPASCSGRRAERPPSGQSGTAGRKVTGQTASRPSRVWVTAMRRPSGHAVHRWGR